MQALLSAPPGLEFTAAGGPPALSLDYSQTHGITQMTDQSPPPTPRLHPDFGKLNISWGWLLALGFLSLLLGTVGLGMEVMMTVASVQLFGVLLLIGGGVQLVNAFQCKGWKGMIWQILIALMYIAAGVVCMTDPLGTSGILTLAIAGILMGIGVMRLMMAFQIRGHSGWVLVLLAGLLALALGVMILVGWPESSLWVIGLFVSIELIFNGWALVFLALAARTAGKAAESADKDAGMSA